MTELRPAGAPVIADDMFVKTVDGYMVAARLWRSPAEEHCGIVAMINAGAGIAQRFYGRFAQYLAVSGITT